ncbi:uncharacterized protein LOC143174886 isoform X1 [Nomia melanderi]|uniref:uncharacterized protein LOC143174886 isoform X1 n=1 Tax=Nomia melanderi TaxID=2448451 RepID=UPI003FCCEA53
MDTFQRNYRVYYSMLYIIALWPFSQSTTSKLQKTFVSACFLCCTIVQVSSIKNVEITLDNLLKMLSFTCPLILFSLRYLGFIINFPLTKSFIEAIDKHCNTLTVPAERKILFNYIKKTESVALIYLGLACVPIIFVISLYLLPAFLHSKHQLYYLQMLGFYFKGQTENTDLISVLVGVSMSLGILTIACTEGSFTVYCFYLCALYEIASYRIKTAVNNGAIFIEPKPINIAPAVYLHQKAHRFMNAISNDLLLTYAPAILLVVISFAVNLYRICLLMMKMDELVEISLSFVIVVAHVVIIFINNHSGQELANASSNLFYQTYNSLWYCVPLKAQKLLLYLLMHTSTDVQINLVGLFVPNYEGFSMMMSSSFSYFTVLLSVQ